MAETVEHIEGGECRCLRCEAFYKGPEYAASIRESRRKRAEQRAAERARLAALKEDDERSRLISLALGSGRRGSAN